VLVLAICVIIGLALLWAKASAKPRPLDRGEVIRMQRFAEQLQREQLLPYE
jgi:hypothetical protein